jgi:hypothetical protein
MGILRQGVLGGFRNKTGTVVGANYRGQDTIRGLPRISKKAPSKGQLDQRMKFGLVTKFLSRISHLINPGFAAATGITSPMNEAVDYHLNNAITGVSPNFSLDLTKLKFSSGKLLTADDLLVESTTPGKLKFSWTHDSQDSSEVDSKDLLTVLAYNPSKGRFVSMRTQVPRSAKTYSLSIPANFSLDLLHCYLSFNSTGIRNLVSDTQYAGTVTAI